MKIYSAANTYSKIITQASNKTYSDLVQVHDLAQALAVDPYEALPTEAAKVAKELASDAAVLADKAFRTGLSGSELKFLTDKLKSKIGYYANNPVLSGLQQELGKMLDKLNSIIMVDVPPQSNVGKVLNKLKEQEEGEGSSYLDFEQSEPAELTPAMRQVVRELGQKDRALSYEEELEPWTVDL